MTVIDNAYEGSFSCSSVNMYAVCIYELKNLYDVCLL